MTVTYEVKHPPEASFRRLSVESYAEAPLKHVPYRLPLYLFGFTFVVGIIPLFLRLSGMRHYVSFFRSNRRCQAFVMAILCMLGGLLLVMCLVNVLPMARSYVHSQESEPFAEMYVCMGFIFTYVLQGIILKRFGNTEHFWTDDSYMCVVQFIRCELNIYPEFIRQFESEDLKETGTQDDSIPVDDVDVLQKVLHMSTDEAVQLRDHLRMDPSTPAELPVSHCRRIRDRLRLKNPRMNPTVCIAVILLCLHSIPDGIFMGLLSGSQMALHAFFGLVFHRCVLCLLIAVELEDMNFSAKAILFVTLTYSLTAPIGSLIASYVSEVAGTDKLALMMGWSGGSLLYVAIFELFKIDKSTHLRSPAEAHCTFVGCIAASAVYFVCVGSCDLYHFWFR